MAVKIREVVQAVEGELLTAPEGLERTVETACGSDLMSDVLAFVKEKTVLITGLINPHVMRTAEMLDIVCVIFSRGKRPSAEMLDMARETGTVIVATEMTTYTVCGELYLRGLPGTKGKTQ